MPSVKVKIASIVQGMEFQTEEHSSYLNLDSGEVFHVEDRLLAAAFEGEEEDELRLPEWQKEEWKIAQRIAESDRFRELPTKYDIHEWSIMEHFALDEAPPRYRDELNRALHGRGAFRQFKDILHRNEIHQLWYDYRDRAFREIAREWLLSHGIEGE